MSGNGNSSATVLVIDDDVVQRTMARGALEGSGYEVIEASCGASALDCVELVSPDIVLLDVQMPGLDGFEVCSVLRANPVVKHVPILMMTGLDDIDSIQHAYEAGATDFAVKPLNWLILSHRVEYMLRASRNTEALRQSRRKLEKAQRVASLGYWEWDLRADRIHLSPGSQRLFDLAGGDESIGIDEFLARVVEDDRGHLEEWIHGLGSGQGIHEMEYRILAEGQAIRFILQQAEVDYDDRGRPTEITGTLQDVTQRRRAEERIRFLANYDSLTGLLNRHSLSEALDKALERAARLRHQVTVLVFDLDRFKRINDTLAHHAGDLILQRVADRLQCLFEEEEGSDSIGAPGQQALTARFGGDEFVVLWSEAAGPTQTHTIARRLLEAFRDPFLLPDREIVVTASVGVAIYPEDGDTGETLLSNADAAMCSAKASGGNAFKFYSESMNSSVLDRLGLEEDLRRTLQRDELDLHYQPQFESSGALVGAESLARWNHPERGQVAPNEFVPLAEESGQIAELGRWALGRACEQAVKWQQEGHPKIRIAVNVSVHQLERDDIVDEVAEVLERSGLDPSLLVLELTESALMKDVDQVRRRLWKLKEMGVRLSIDDFGTGYSSLSYLRRFPLDSLKIDRSFLQGLPDDGDHLAIVRAILAMAKSLRLKVVAEGVETSEQRDLLRDEGCDEMQGFLLGRPVPADCFFASGQSKDAATSPREQESSAPPCSSSDEPSELDRELLPSVGA